VNINIVITGAVSGVLYMISGASLVLVYRASRLLNFALGGMGGFAAYVAWAVLNSGLPYWFGYVLAMATGGFIGWLTELVIVRRVSQSRHIVAAIATLGVLLALEGLVIGHWGTTPLALSTVFGSIHPLQFGSAVITANDVYVVAVTALLFAGLYLVLYRTGIGLRMRAAAQGRVTASIVGVNVTNVSSWSWTIGGLVGAVAALLVIPTTNLSPESFTDFIFFGFAAIVIGGLTSIPGVMAGSLIFGVAINLVAAWLSTSLTQTFTLLFVAAVLVARPEGLFGRAERSVPEARGLRAEGFPRRREGTRGVGQRFTAITRPLRERGTTGWGLPAYTARSSDPSPEAGVSRSRAYAGLTAVVVVLAILAPYLFGPGIASLLPTIAATIPAVIGLVILYGWAGQVSAGNGALLAVGTYATGLLMGFGHLPFFASLVLAVVISFIVGVLIGLPSLRVKSYIYFALYTFMVANAAPELILYFSRWTGGENGLVMQMPGILNTSEYAQYWFCLAIAAATIGFTIWAGRSAIGRRWRAARDSPAGAAASGISLGRTSVLAFGVCSALTGLSGALQAGAVGIASPDSYSIWASVYLLVAISIGGPESIAGAVLGAIFINIVPYLAGGSISPDIAYGLILIIVLIFAPNGVLASADRALRSIAGLAHRWLRPPRSAGGMVAVATATAADGSGTIAVTGQGRGVEARGAQARAEDLAAVGRSRSGDVVAGTVPVVAEAGPVAVSGSTPSGTTEEHAAPLLELRRVAVSYGDAVAVEGVSMTIEKDQVVCLLGPNGAGKSSILRAISGVARVAGGSIRLSGEEIVGLRPWQIAGHGISQVVEGRGIFPDLTVHENLRIGALVSRNAQTGMSDSLDLVLEVFPDLAGRLRQSGGSLSGGQQQMLAIGRGIMSRPRLLLCDEPTLGLAPRTAETMMEGLGQLRKSGLSILLVEQNISGLRIADEVKLMRSGEIWQSLSGTRALQQAGFLSSYLSGDEAGGT
jgi:ABC-type branched-subunit amino acid transport system ATPase component/branched-subunit amino acid ABC-type transport system permease component